MVGNSEGGEEIALLLCAEAIRQQRDSDADLAAQGKGWDSALQWFTYISYLWDEKQKEKKKGKENNKNNKKATENHLWWPEV